MHRERYVIPSKLHSTECIVLKIAASAPPLGTTAMVHPLHCAILQNLLMYLLYLLIAHDLSVSCLFLIHFKLIGNLLKYQLDIRFSKMCDNM